MICRKADIVLSTDDLTLGLATDGSVIFPFPFIIIQRTTGNCLVYLSREGRTVGNNLADAIRRSHQILSLTNKGKNLYAQKEYFLPDAGRVPVEGAV